MSSETLWPGSWPPSPGFEPWAILICRTSALTRYSVVTPKRPLATCLTALRRLSPLGSMVKRVGSSPPSPVLDFPPMRFMAMASVSWASFEVEEAAQGGEARAVLVEVTGELLEGLEAPCLDGALEWRDARLVPQMILTLRPELVLAPDLEFLRVALGGREGAPVAFEGLPCQRVHPDAANARGGARKAPVYELLVQAYGLEDLGPAVGEERGDAHLGDDLEQTLPYGLDVVLRRLLGADTFH